MTHAMHEHPVLRVATWNIHKGVQGLGPLKRLEIMNIGHAIEQLDCDVVCLQEVRFANRREARRFAHWPELPQADFLAPEGYVSVYRTNAVTRDGEHGNALLSRWAVLSHQHEDMSDHRFEQRGLLHTEVEVAGRSVHVLVVHLGLIPASRDRQVLQLKHYIERQIPPGAPVIVAGDFNDWGSRLTHALARFGLHEHQGERTPTYPSRLPLTQLDHVYARGLRPLSTVVPKGRIWRQMSDHLPLVAEFVWSA
jgi:endonuclease/exonuclease/phosphatase family metal-dependent hydrolase